MNSATESWTARTGLPALVFQVFFDEIYCMNLRRMLKAVREGKIYMDGDYSKETDRKTGNQPTRSGSIPGIDAVLRPFRPKAEFTVLRMVLWSHTSATSLAQRSRCRRTSFEPRSMQRRRSGVVRLGVDLRTPAP
jgi:hypothetical protein